MPASSEQDQAEELLLGKEGEHPPLRAIKGRRLQVDTKLLVALVLPVIGLCFLLYTGNGGISPQQVKQTEGPQLVLERCPDPAAIPAHAPRKSEPPGP